MALGSITSIVNNFIPGSTASLQRKCSLNSVSSQSNLLKITGGDCFQKSSGMDNKSININMKAALQSVQKTLSGFDDDMDGTVSAKEIGSDKANEIDRNGDNEVNAEEYLQYMIFRNGQDFLLKFSEKDNNVEIGNEIKTNNPSETFDSDSVKELINQTGKGTATVLKTADITEFPLKFSSLATRK